MSLRLGRLCCRLGLHRRVIDESHQAWRTYLVHGVSLGVCARCGERC